MNGLLHGGGFKLLGIQAMGTITAVIFVLTAMTIIFKFSDKIFGLWVSNHKGCKKRKNQERQDICA